MYPDYAVFFMVPDEGIELEEPFIHDSQFDLSTSHAPVDSFGSMVHAHCSDSHFLR